MYSTRLAYVHLKVRHLEAAVTFYTRFLDLQLSERFGRTALLVSSESPDHFELALSEGEPVGPTTLGFVVPSAADFEAARRFLKLENWPHQALDRDYAWVLALNDPDGNRIELVLDRRSENHAYWRGHERFLD